MVAGIQGSSKPVRIGNAAVGATAARRIRQNRRRHASRERSGKSPNTSMESSSEWALLDHLEKIWREPDEGIWEVRGGPQQFLPRR